MGALHKGSYILIGTATCGWAAGGLDVVDAFDKELARRGLEAPIIEVGCMGLCHADPFVIIFKPGSLRVHNDFCHTDHWRDIEPGLVNQGLLA